MASILVNIEHGIEVAAEDVLQVIPFVKTMEAKAVKAAPEVVAALAVVIGGTAKALTAVDAAAVQPLNIVLDAAAVNALKAVWPEVVAFAKTIGVTL